MIGSFVFVRCGRQEFWSLWNFTPRWLLAGTPQPAGGVYISAATPQQRIPHCIRLDDGLPWMQDFSRRQHLGAYITAPSFRLPDVSILDTRRRRIRFERGNCTGLFLEEALTPLWLHRRPP
ncbi:hypothetical protein E4U40_002630 [Claviceps sp. LM458 group G5]|nr:hypothetical protein E4U40_002630 [Claviceps sp. LM458 group G5]